MKCILVIFLIFIPFFCLGQSNDLKDWTENEKANYKTLKELAHYVNGKEKSEISREILFYKYIEFNYVLKDTSITRIEKRIQAFDTLFYSFRNTIDSLGVENLDVKPIRFYKNHKIYKPFDGKKAKKSVSGKKMYTRDSNVFAYYRKEDPGHPLGTLLFDEKSHKLIAWILVNQGGYYYFLSFNLL